ncbi:hypothetical protein KQH65_12160 [archaeon]|nr:hypothetical protein [archaeon]
MSQDFKTLQLFYAAALADATYHYGRHRVLDTVTNEKKAAQDLAAPSHLRALGVTDLPGIYRRFSELFGCAAWNVEESGETVTAEAGSCMLCALAKKQGAPQPCRPFCINPFAAFAKELDYELDVEETLWDGRRCRFVNKK